MERKIVSTLAPETLWCILSAPHIQRNFLLNQWDLLLNLLVTESD